MRAPSIVIVLGVLGAAPGSPAADTPPAWPPSAAAQERIAELRGVLFSREASPAQREAARRELSAVLRNPAAPREPVTPSIAPPRAAIAPFPAIASPLAILPSAPAAVVVPAPRAIPAWPDAERETPASRFKVNPSGGALLVETPQGYVDPRTGHRIPKR